MTKEHTEFQIFVRNILELREGPREYYTSAELAKPESLGPAVQSRCGELDKVVGSQYESGRAYVR